MNSHLLTNQNSVSVSVPVNVCWCQCGRVCTRLSDCAISLFTHLSESVQLGGSVFPRKRFTDFIVCVVAQWYSGEPGLHFQPFSSIQLKCKPAHCAAMKRQYNLSCVCAKPHWALFIHGHTDLRRFLLNVKYEVLLPAGVAGLTQIFGLTAGTQGFVRFSFRSHVALF